MLSRKFFDEKQGRKGSARSAEKSFARLFKGGGIPKGRALWPRPQARNTPGRAAKDRKPDKPTISHKRQTTLITARPQRLCREACKQPAGF